MKELSSAGLDGAARSAEILYMSLPGDSDHTEQVTERITKRQLDSLIEVGDTTLHEVFVQDVALTVEIINGPAEK